MENKKTLALIVGAVLVVVIVGAALFIKRPPSGGPERRGTNGGGEQGSATKTEVPKGATVPEKGAANVPGNVATPQIVGPAAPTTDAKFRSFNMQVEGGKFVPDTVIVRKGDTVHINIAAVDKDYDFYQPDYGFSFPLPKGKGKVLEFGATAEGKYTFFCRECGGPEKGPLGYIVVVAK